MLDGPEARDADRPAPARAWLGWAAMVLATVAAFLLIRSCGESLPVPAAGGDAPVRAARAAGGSVLLRVLIALAAIVIVGRLLARAFARIGQPPVFGEVLAGILLGPSLLGAELSSRILPIEIAPALGVVAQLGVVLYMFSVGVELDLHAIGRRAHAAIAISHASILAPFLLGAWLALPLYPRLASGSVPFTTFALFLGVAMSITAFPVLARILGDSGMSRTPLGTLALGSAAVADVTAWCLLAFVVGVARAEAGAGLLVAAGALAFVAGMFLLVRPLLRRAAARLDERPEMTLLLVALLLSAIGAEAIGVHAVFGAFLLGAIVPRELAAARTLARELEGVVGVLLLPAFFAFTGMRTHIRLLSEPSDWLACAAIVLVATVGKLGGTLLAARATGLDWRAGAVLGALMNTRGLMELIVLHVGLELGLVSPELFAMMVVMALVTTGAAGPLLRWLGAWRDDPQPVAR